MNFGANGEKKYYYLCILSMAKIIRVCPDKDDVVRTVPVIITTRFAYDEFKG